MAAADTTAAPPSPLQAMAQNFAALSQRQKLAMAAALAVAIALLAFRGADRESLVAHMHRAIRLGATREELFEVLEATLVPGGAPTFHRGLSALLEVE